MSHPSTIPLDRLLYVLKASHRGQENAISGKALAAHFGVRETKRIRESVNQLRREGELIGSCHDGYFIPANRQEALAALSFITKIFEPLRLAVNGYRAAMDREFGPETLFDDLEEAV